MPHNIDPRLPLFVATSLLTVVGALGAACDSTGPVEPEPPPDAGCIAESPCGEEVCGIVIDGCGEEVACDACRDAAEVDALMTVVDRAVETFVNQSYMHDILELDVDAIRSQAAFTLENTPVDPQFGDDPALLGALGKTVRAFRNGHSAVYRLGGGCGPVGAADSYQTRYGVCARPFEDHFVVTHQVGPSNPLGLSAGDSVVGLNQARGLEMVDAVLDRALCSGGTASVDGDQELAAGSLFSVLAPDDALVVVNAAGEERSVSVGSQTLSSAPCGIPGAPAFEPFVAGHLRPDGVAVIRLSRMILFPGEEGHINATTEAEFGQYLENMVAQVKAVFDEVTPQATGLIWDVRGNIGGASRVGFAIAEGMPGAVPTALARCSTRVPLSDPVTYNYFGPDYDLEPSADELFAFAGKVALLIDGRSISAADYFALAMANGTDTRLFGRPTAGAFGGGGNTVTLDETRGIGLSYDPYRCNDPVTGDALETHSVQPHQWVEYAPKDLAEGIDSVVEAAALYILTE